MKIFYRYIIVFSILSILGLIVLDFILLPFITSNSNIIYIPDVRYKSIYKAEKILTSENFNIEIIKSEFNEEFKPNTVIKMSPRPFTKVKKGRLIKLTVTGDKKNIIVRDYLNMSINNAKLSIKRYGLSVDTLIYEYSNNVKKGRVTSQYPKKGKILETNDKISFVVSLGDPPNYYTVPNLINLNYYKAKTQISNAGLIIGTINYEYNPEYLNKTVLDQSLTPGVKMSFPGKINLIISTDRKE